MKRNKVFSTLLRSIILSACVFGSSAALAAFPSFGGSTGTDPSTSPIPADDKTALAGIPCSSPEDCLASGYGNSLRDLLFSPVYKQNHIMAGGFILSAILHAPPNATTTMNDNVSQSVMSLIYNQGNIADNLLKTTPAIFAPNIAIAPLVPTGPGSSLMAKVTAKAQGSGVPLIANFFQSSVSEAQQQSALNSVNFDSFITPRAYKKVNIGGSGDDNQMDQQMVANTFIQYVTGLANPLQPADFTNMKVPPKYFGNKSAYIYDLQKKPEVRDYLTSLRNYTAQLSVGISNFYYLYNERSPITDPKALEKARAITAMPGSPTASLPDRPVSPLEIEQFIATRRLADANWYAAMQNALPSTLLRESLFILAEIPPMLFQLHLDLERILATMSAMQMQQAGNNRLFLEQSVSKVNQILQNPEQAQSEAEQAAKAAQEQVNQEELEQASKAYSDQQQSQQ